MCSYTGERCLKKHRTRRDLLRRKPRKTSSIEAPPVPLWFLRACLKSSPSQKKHIFGYKTSPRLHCVADTLQPPSRFPLKNLTFSGWVPRDFRQALTLLAVEFFMDVAKMFVGNMRIYLRRVYARVTQERLYTPDVGAVLQKIRREAVAHGMRRDFFRNSGLYGIFLHNAFYRAGGEARRTVFR